MAGLTSLAASLEDMIRVVQEDPVSLIPEREWLGGATVELDLVDESVVDAFS